MFTKRLYSELKGCIVFLFIFLQSPSLNAQLFERVDSVTVNISARKLSFPWAGGLNNPQLSNIDFNSDGKKDIFVFDRCGDKILPFVNYGDSGISILRHEPDYVPYFPSLHYWALLVDYNMDGKEDIFTSNFVGYQMGVAVYKNISDASGLMFSLEKPILRVDNYHVFVSQWDIPAIADVDYDGDIDVLTFDIIAGTLLSFYKNTSMELYGIPDSLTFTEETDCWGTFSENPSTCTVTLGVCYKSAASEKFHAGSTILALDLDGDADMELVVGDIGCNTLYMLTNGGDSDSAYMAAYEANYPPSYPVNLYRFPAAFYMDADNDLIKDLVSAPNGIQVFENSEGVWQYKNIGTNSYPQFIFTKDAFLQEEMIETGEGAYPCFFDYNADSLPDIVIGNYGFFDPPNKYKSSLSLYKNTGSKTNPSFEFVTRDYAAVQYLNLSAVFPAFGDLDGDGDPDMLIGDYNGNLHYFKNSSAPGTPAYLLLYQANFENIDVGSFATPQIVDVDGDGLPDLLIGEQSGNINYYRNTGNAQSPAFTLLTDSFGKVDVRQSQGFSGYSIPFLAQWDSSGDPILLVSCSTGAIFRYTDIEGNLAGTFTVTDTFFQGLYEGIRTSVSGGDINGDTSLDMIIGNYAGGVALYNNLLPPPRVQQPLPPPPPPVPLAFKIARNPSSNFIELKFEGVEATDMAYISMYDIRGRKVFQKTFHSSELTDTDDPVQIPLYVFDNGIYFCKIKIRELQQIVKTAVVK